MSLDDETKEEYDERLREKESLLDDCLKEMKFHDSWWEDVWWGVDLLREFLDEALIKLNLDPLELKKNAERREDVLEVLTTVGEALDNRTMVNADIPPYDLYFYYADKKKSLNIILFPHRTRLWLKEKMRRILSKIARHSLRSKGTLPEPIMTERDDDNYSFKLGDKVFDFNFGSILRDTRSFSRRVNETEKKFVKGFYEIVKDVYQIFSRPNDFSCIATGKQGILVRNRGEAWKFSRDKEKERRLLKKTTFGLRDKRNVVKLNISLGWEDPHYGGSVGGIDDIIMEEPKYFKLEYIEGDTLAEILKGGKFSYEEIKKYSSDIIDGILELRERGIYHRDIHDYNIMIDEDSDRAVIIDLGVATEDSDEIYAENRAYGGNNDLVSFGQLMYKMATGHNLFNEGPGFTCYSAVKDGIKTERERVYDNPEELVRCFERVRENVKGELGELIVSLLDDDLWTQPSLQHVQETKKVFEEYLK